MAFLAWKSRLPLLARCIPCTKWNPSISSTSTRQFQVSNGPQSQTSVGASKCPTPVPKMIHSPIQIGIVPDNKRYKRLMTLQTHFCRPDGTPVWLKMGQRDKMFYQLTLLLILGGSGSTAYLLSQMLKK